MGWGVYDYSDPPENRGAVCPVCGAPCYKIYKRGGEIVGCDDCIDEVDAEEEDECFDYPGGARR